MFRPLHEPDRFTVSNPSQHGIQRMSQGEEDGRLLSWEVCDEAIARLIQATSNDADTSFTVHSMWSSGLRWARNRASMTSDRRNVEILVTRYIRGARGSASTNQIDDASIEGVVRAAERMALRDASIQRVDAMIEAPPPPIRESTTWSDATFSHSVEEAAQFVKRATSVAEEKSLSSAGYLERAGARFAIFHSKGIYGNVVKYHAEYTQAQCSTTVRHPKGTSSGWAGLAAYDINKIDTDALAAHALEKCIAAADPVRIEPGRYTTILEPQAVSDLASLLIGNNSMGAMVRRNAEGSRRDNPWVLEKDQSSGRIRNRLGLRVVDERITISHDPSDPELGVVSDVYVEPITWIERGELKTLAYDRDYALLELNEDSPAVSRGSFRMSGGSSTMDEMISSTKRGLIVTRFSSIEMIDMASVLATGFTRDGLWLVENGKISKAVRNFRFTESPLFAFNNIDQLGVPVPVFQPWEYPEYNSAAPRFALQQVIVPPMKVNDFSFTSTIDAV